MNEHQLIYSAILHARRRDHDSLYRLVVGLDLGERDALIHGLAAAAAEHVPLSDEQIASACLGHAAREGR